MTYRTMARAACIAVALAAATSVHATNVEYVLSGLIDLDLGGQIFDGVTLTLTGVGDPANSHVVGGNTTFTPLMMLTATVQGFGVFPVPDTVEFFSNPGLSTAGFFDTVDSNDILDFVSPVFASYDGISPLPPTSVTFSYSHGFDTPYGNALVSDGGGLTLSASAVPEAASWALMIFGTAVAGGAMRRRWTTAAATS